jgi:hypothetical protein
MHKRLHFKGKKKVLQANKDVILKLTRKHLL